MVSIKRVYKLLFFIYICYIQGWKWAVPHRKMRITFEVIANHFGKVIRNIANHFKVICESLFAKRPFLDDLSITFLVLITKFPPFYMNFMYTLRYCESLCQCVSQNAIHSSFLKSSSGDISFLL